jgi:YVTN family beta-propeller protein
MAPAAREPRLAALRAQRTERRAKLNRRTAALARAGVSAAPRTQAAGRSIAGELLQPARVYLVSTVTFANPTSSFFGTLYLAGPTYYLGSDITVAARVETGMSVYHNLFSTTSAARKITSHGADVRDLDFHNVSWILLDGSDVGSMDYVEFEGMDPTIDQFTIARTSNERASCDCYRYYKLYEWSFHTTPTTGKYIRATDTDGGANVLELKMEYTTPGVHSGYIAKAGGALITSWLHSGVFVSNTDGGNISHFNGQYDSHVDCTTLAVSCSEPRNPAASPNGRLVAVPFRFSDRVAFFDPVTSDFVSSVTDASMDEPYAVAFSGDGSELWVANKKGGGSNVGSITIINVATRAVVNTITATELSSPEGITIAAGKAFVANRGAGTVTILNVATRAVLMNVTVGGDPRDVVGTPDGQWVYVTKDAGSVAKVKVSDGTVTQLTIAGSSRNITISPDGLKVYVANQGNGVAVITVATDAVGLIAFAGASNTYGVAILKDGSMGFVTDSNLGKVYAFDPVTGFEVLSGPFPFSVGSGPRGIVAY